MANSVRFSVVIPLYNKAPHVARGLRSVFGQTFADFEVLVIDDASSDGSLVEVTQFGDQRLEVLQRDAPGAGGYAARNLGIRHAGAEWIAFLDADDEWYPDHLQHYAALIERFPSSSVLACGWDIYDPDGLYATRSHPRYYIKHHSRGSHVITFDEYLRAELERRKPIHTSTACIRRSTLLAVGAFPHNRTAKGGDIDTWLRCIAHAGSMTWSNHVGGIYHHANVNMVSKARPLTAACERETIRCLLPDQAPSTAKLLRRYSNSRTLFAWRQHVKWPGQPPFPLVDKLYIRVDPVRALFWLSVSLMPPAFYISIHTRVSALKRAIRSTPRKLKRHPIANAARFGRTLLLRFTSTPTFPAPPRAPTPTFLSNDRGETFFGYHDKTPFSEDGSKILAMAVPRSGKPSGRAASPITIGYFPTPTKRSPGSSFVPLADTSAWCWQQGCMLQWDPLEANRHIVFNTFRNGRYGATVLDVDRRRPIAAYASPIYAIDPTGRYAASINFARLDRLRPGYGYAQLPDPTAGIPAPDNDGLVLLDFAARKAELVLNLADLAAEVGQPFAEHYVNHLTFAPDGSRLIFFHLWTAGDQRDLRCCILDVRNGHRTTLEADRTVSHYCWRDSNSVLATTRTRSGGWHYSLYNLLDATRRDIDLPLTRDGHPMFHPAHRDIIVTDTYPDRRRDQSLYTANLASGAIALQANLYAPFRYHGPGRCDLHPRWDRSGHQIVVDTTARGRREMALIQPQL